MKDMYIRVILTLLFVSVFLVNTNTQIKNSKLYYITSFVIGMGIAWSWLWNI